MRRRVRAKSRFEKTAQGHSGGRQEVDAREERNRDRNLGETWRRIPGQYYSMVDFSECSKGLFFVTQVVLVSRDAPPAAG